MYMKIWNKLLFILFLMEKISRKLDKKWLHENVLKIKYVHVCIPTILPFKKGSHFECQICVQFSCQSAIWWRSLNEQITICEIVVPEYKYDKKIIPNHDTTWQTNQKKL